MVGQLQDSLQLVIDQFTELTNIPILNKHACEEYIGIVVKWS